MLRRGQWLRYCAGLVAALVLLSFMAVKVGRDELALAVSRADLRFLAASIAASLLSLWLKAHRWSAAVAAGGPDRPRHRLFSAFVIGLAANQVLPVRLGDLARAMVLRDHNSIQVARSLAAGWCAQLFDALTVILILLIGGGTLASRSALLWLVFALLLLLGGLGFDVRQGGKLEQWALHKLPWRIRSRIEDLAGSARAGLAFVGHGKTLLKVLLLTLAVWFVEIGTLTLAFRAFGLSLDPAVAALLSAAGALTFILPLTPGNLGVYQVVCILVLTPFGVSRGSALVFSAGYQAASLLVVALLAAGFLHREGKHRVTLANLESAARPSQLASGPGVNQTSGDSTAPPAQPPRRSD